MGGVRGGGTTGGRRRPAVSSRGRRRPSTAAGPRDAAPRPPAGRRAAAGGSRGGRIPADGRKPLFFLVKIQKRTPASSVRHAEPGLRLEPRSWGEAAGGGRRHPSHAAPPWEKNVQSVRTGYAPSLQQFNQKVSADV